MSDTGIEKDVAERSSGLQSTLDPVEDRHASRQAVNATNWSLASKIYHTAIPCFLAFLMWVLKSQ